MTRHRSTPLDRAAAEHLLAGAANHGADGPHAALAGLLAAAAAPARSDALPGEEAALAAFRTVQLPAPEPRRSSMLGRLLTLKVAVGAATLLTAGGVALAASDGALPGAAADPAKSQSSAEAQVDQDAPGRAASPSPSMEGLCRAYGKAGDNPGKALQNPAFRALIKAAGGKDKVSGFCDKLLDEPENRSGGDPAPDDRGRGNDTGKDNHPSGPPTDRPGK